MKTIISVFLSLIILFPLVGLAQTSNIQTPPTLNTKPTPCTQDAKICPDGSSVGRTGPKCEFAACQSNPSISKPVRKCGVNTFIVKNECGVGAFKNAYVQCYDGYEATLGDATSCKSSETWQEYTKEACDNRCSFTKEPTGIPQPFSQPIPMIVSPPVRLTPPIAIESKPIAVLKDHCGEVAQWENKSSYYKKLSGLSDDDLKKDGFSREEIEKILQNLSIGLEKIKTKCGNQTGTLVAPDMPSGDRGGQSAPPTVITDADIIAESIKPVVVESGKEINVYYKTKLEKAASAPGTEQQREELKTLRGEIEGLISNLIKSRKELEASELGTVVKKIKVSQGEIKADNVAVKTTEKKIFLNVGDRPVSVEPTASHTLIRDKGLEVKTNEVTITENVLTVGGIEVKTPASAVAEKFNLIPTDIQLTKENNKAVYSIKIEERRKLFGFIPLHIQKTITADAENSAILSERLPWYRFLTTK